MTQHNSNSNLNIGATLPTLDSTQLTQLTQAVAGLSKDQLIWASGYLAGLSSSALSTNLVGTVPTTQSVSTTAVKQTSVTVLYGSQTGNSKHAAVAFNEQLVKQGAKASLVSMADYKPRKIKDETHLVIFVSTHGEGDAPDDAIELHEFLSSKKAPKLPNLHYAIVALGDSSYEYFCQTGKDFDAKLAGLGAKPILERLDCDVDYADEIAAWSDHATKQFVASLTPVEVAQTLTNLPINNAIAVSNNQYNKQNPFTATLLSSQKITGRDSIKDIRHIEISLEGSNLQYQAGDSLGVYFKNEADLVQRIIAASHTKAEDEVTLKGGKFTLKDALTDKLELTLSYPGFVKAYQAVTQDKGLQALLDDKPTLRTFLEERQIVNIIEQFPNKISAQALADALRPIAPRLYSIASSQSEVEDEVHLTVAHIDYEAFGSRHQGGASGFLSTRLQEGDHIDVYIEDNSNFRLPADLNTPIIMIGPGTGIAPFRAFLQEREASEAQGKNWLFFGNPSFTQDFLYQVEWQGYKKSGLLNKISLAFSRDQEHKIYVQDRLIENGQEVYDWLQQGAHVYVCGDAMHMAKDVEAALITIIHTHGNISQADAKQYLVDMRKSKRYQKDVY